MNRINKLKDNYEKACIDYINEFCKKQDMEFHGWVANQVGETALCNDFYFNFSDIVWDVNSEQPKGEIVDWYYHSIDNYKTAVNYYHWTKMIKNEN